MSQLELDFYSEPSPCVGPPEDWDGTKLKIAGDLSREAVRIAHAFGLPALGDRVAVYWSGRKSSRAGTALPGLARIVLNAAIAEFGVAEIRRTFLHELAHLIAHARAGRQRIRPHGPEWRQACADLGIPGEPVHHDLPLQGPKQERRHFYRCAHCGTTIARVRKLSRRYACAACCKKHHGGKYSDRYVLVPVPGPSG